MNAEDINPYESPPSPVEKYDELLEQLRAGDATCWRDEKMLVIRFPAQLPSRCVKSNAPTSDGDLTPISFTWISKLVQMVPDNIRIPLPLAARWRWRRRCAMILSALLAVIGIASMVLGNRILHDFTFEYLACFLWVCALIVAGFASHGLGLFYCDGNFAWLTGVNRRFLAELPPWPAGRPWLR